MIQLIGFSAIVLSVCQRFIFIGAWGVNVGWQQQSLLLKINPFEPGFADTLLNSSRCFVYFEPSAVQSLH